MKTQVIFKVGHDRGLRGGFIILDVHHDEKIGRFFFGSFV